MTDTKKSMANTPAKKAWKDLELKQLNVPSATQTGGATRFLQPGEAFNFYRNS